MREGNDLLGVQSLMTQHNIFLFFFSSKNRTINILKEFAVCKKGFNNGKHAKVLAKTAAMLMTKGGCGSNEAKNARKRLAI